MLTKRQMSFVESALNTITNIILTFQTCGDNKYGASQPRTCPVSAKIDSERLKVPAIQREKRLCKQKCY